MKKEKSQHYSEQFKRQVVQDVLEGKYSKEAARRIHGIKSKCAVLYWIRKFSGQKNYRQPSEFELKSNKQKKISEQNKSRRIEELEAELNRERQRAELWKKMVEIAEEDLGIEIRKKYGAKQLFELKKKAEKR
jgi:transposase-like protein